jgi:Leucine-rich repeat (LRR) protein
MALGFTPTAAKSFPRFSQASVNYMASTVLSPVLPGLDHEWFRLGEEEKIERVYVRPTPEDLEKTAEQVRTFNCATVTDVPLVECFALVALYGSTNGAGWANRTNWLATTTVGTWFGVSVSGSEIDRHVFSLSLQSNQLSGSIPPELGNLSSLNYLHLFRNQLSGSIPAQLGNLSSLLYLMLHENQLSGSIPPELGNLSSLEYLSLDYNNLSGSIPPELGNLNNLGYIALQDNQLSGSIPPELGNLSHLQRLNLYNNQLSGSIPPELGNLSSLNYLHLYRNQLSGGIPPELGDLSSLQSLDLFENQLSGSIPPELGNLSSLGILYLDNNQLSGSIPPELGNLYSLEYLSLSRNQLSGSIPPELGSLIGLREMWLSTNQLTGSIPPELGSLIGLREMWLSSNQLTGAIPTELGNLSSLEWLNLNQNMLSGDVPPEIISLVNLCTPDITGDPCDGMFGLDLGYNHLNVPAPEPPASFLTDMDPDWYLTQAVSETIAGDTGGTIVSNDGNTEIVIPTGAVSGDIDFLFDPQRFPSHGADGLVFARNSFELTAEDSLGNPVIAFNSPITATIAYDEGTLGEIAEDSLRLYYWDESASAWLDVATTCPGGVYTRDLTANWLSVPLCHLSEFALMGEIVYSTYLPLIIR